MKRAFFALLISLFVVPAQALDFGFEVDALHPALRSLDRTKFDRSWFSPRLYLGEKFHIGGEFIHDDGEVSGSSVSGGTPIGDPSAETFYKGVSFGYYLSGSRENSLRFSGTFGRAERTFRDSNLGSSKSEADFRILEAGYQRVVGNGVLAFSGNWLTSDLAEDATFTSGPSTSNLNKKKSDFILKVALGYIF